MISEEMTAEEAMLVIAVIGSKHDNDCYEALREMAFDTLRKMPVLPKIIARSEMDILKLHGEECGKEKRTND